MRVWHYTKGIHIASIISDGHIRPSRALPERPRPTVWASSSPVWERTTAPRVMDRATGVSIWVRAMRTAHQLVSGLFRIEVVPSTVPVSWQEYKEIGRITPEEAQLLERLGRDQGSDPAKWWAGFEPIRSEYWLHIERWQDGEWVPAGILEGACRA